jgi:hypothetical protein
MSDFLDSKKNPTVSFECRICGCKTYERKNCMSGSRYGLKVCCCNGCSSIFTDPEKFSATSEQTSKAQGENKP